MEIAEQAGHGVPGARGNRLDFDTLYAHAEQAWSDLGSAIERIRSITGYRDFLAESDFDDIARVVQPDIPVAYVIATSQGGLALVAHRTKEVAEVSLHVAWADEVTADEVSSLLVEYEGENVVGGYLPGQLGELDWMAAALTKALPLLGERLIAPVATELRQCKAEGVVFILGGLLGLLPLHAARYQVDGNDVHLLDEFGVTYAPSARVLTASRVSLDSLQDRSPLLAGVGNPLPNPKPLRFARAELGQIECLFQESHPLFERDATEGQLHAALAGASHVHLACHGLFDANEPLNSYLQLADGSLTLRQLLEEQRFQETRLVVLSACQTAVTDFHRLPDEAIGLPAGCLQAGAAGVVGTLWAVDDLSTMLLMERFYRYHLHGDSATGEGALPPALALRRAQCWLRDVTAGELQDYFEERRAEAQARPEGPGMALGTASAGVIRFGTKPRGWRPYADSPYHWAPFILIGA